MLVDFFVFAELPVLLMIWYWAWQEVVFGPVG